MLEPFLGKSEFANHGQRVVEGQRLMQSASDIMLGWLHTTGIDGVGARLLRPPALGREGLGGRRGAWSRTRWRPTPSSAAGRSPRRTPAPATRSRSASYLGSGDVFDKAIAEFAERYADQNERDYEALEQAVASGRVQAQRGL